MVVRQLNSAFLSVTSLMLVTGIFPYLQVFINGHICVTDVAKFYLSENEL